MPTYVSLNTCIPELAFTCGDLQFPICFTFQFIIHLFHGCYYYLLGWIRALHNHLHSLWNILIICSIWRTAVTTSDWDYVQWHLWQTTSDWDSVQWHLWQTTSDWDSVLWHLWQTTSDWESVQWHLDRLHQIGPTSHTTSLQATLQAKRPPYKPTSHHTSHPTSLLATQLAYKLSY